MPQLTAQANNLQEMAIRPIQVEVTNNLGQVTDSVKLRCRNGYTSVVDKERRDEARWPIELG